MGPCLSAHKASELPAKEVYGRSYERLTSLVVKKLKAEAADRSCQDFARKGIVSALEDTHLP